MNDFFGESTKYKIMSDSRIHKKMAHNTYWRQYKSQWRLRFWVRYSCWCMRNCTNSGFLRNTIPKTRFHDSTVITNCAKLMNCIVRYFSRHEFCYAKYCTRLSQQKTQCVSLSEQAMPAKTNQTDQPTTSVIVKTKEKKRTLTGTKSKRIPRNIEADNITIHMSFGRYKQTYGP